jgi:hypothetical protein
VASEELFRKLDKLTDARITRALIGTI